ncbi:uncharacterized protein EI97DRAFT_446688 [Westerdykella ornata]|uniref:ISWI chromatin-remodeling complex ATPase ISW2 n=1 Tax=Westerdykella ornata TaxID=318751 RepID=A0A6A6J590_WESOR|nr:uncharacterized protein EI97DRAFT_446688 [Westerdykella ornata]KAF2271357.1 hypothetical protein EI97DRAFT_446688 [Westerdykella ornata]
MEFTGSPSAAQVSQPVTPKHRPATYRDLLQSFGTRSSATSVTKARRISAIVSHEQASPAAGGASKPELSRLRSFTTDSELELSEPRSTSTAFTSPTKSVPAPIDDSEDELHSSTQETKRAPRRSQTMLGQGGEELKMEPRRNDRRGDAPRRSARNRKSNILESDTLHDELALTPPKMKAPPRPKLDTARQRLRDDIAAQTKAKANNFLVAHKDYFLPLLPRNNYVSKLVAKGPIVEYEELKEQPRGVTATMKPYQLSGLSFLVYLHNNGFSGILGDEMGLGKTLQTLSLFQYLEEKVQETGVHSEELRPYLVVCPLSVLNSWVGEAKKWVPGLKVLRFHGTAKEREHLKRVAQGMEDKYGNETLQAMDRKASRKAGLSVPKLPTEQQGSQSYKLVVTTYEAFLAEQTWFKHSFVWRYIVLDEGHRIKNNITNISSALKSVSAEYRLILTGTPLQNNLVEMWALLAWLYPDVFTASTADLFKQSFDLGRGQVNKQTLDDARRLLELIMLRRMKDSPGVDLNLPPKEEVLLYVPLTPMQRFWYTRLLTRVDEAILEDLFANVQVKEKDVLQKEKEEDEMWAKVEELERKPEGEKTEEWQETAEIMKQVIEKEKSEAGSGSRNDWQKLMNLVMQLRKCCSHPYLIKGACPDPYYLGDHVIRASGKFILLEKLLKHQIFEEKKKVLIFSGFKQTLACVEDLLVLLGDHGRDFKYLRLDGDTSRARRNLGIRMFNDPKSDYKVMLLSTRAGGLGINLTSAEDVIFLDEDWNPQITLQAEARAHRIGQTKKVTIYKLCTQGTVEEQMMGRIRKKLYLSAKITESMRNIHTEGAKAKGRPSTTEDMPQMGTTQLKSLVRRGAQTLSHPDINVTEMLSWDLDTMLRKCRDKPSDIVTSEADEEKWLATMERVECAVFDGKRHHRALNTDSPAANILPPTISREDRRKGKNVTVMVDGFAISKESLNCADWEAVPTLAGKDPRLAEAKREKRRDIAHQTHCHACFEYGDLIQCRGCPRSYHFNCLEPDFQVKTKNFGGFVCPQHQCVDCGKRTADAGGLIYRCRWCANGFCEDCLDWDNAELIGENLPELEVLGEPPMAGAFYIVCPPCKEAAEENEERREWMQGLETAYKEQHEQWVQARDQEQREIEEEMERDEQARKGRKMDLPDRTVYRNKQASRLNGHLARLDRYYSNGDSASTEESDTGSPTSLTDSSLTTPALGGSSGRGTPNLIYANGRNGNGRNNKRRPIVRDEEDYDGVREEKRPRLNIRDCDGDDDGPVVRGRRKSAYVSPSRMNDSGRRY